MYMYMYRMYLLFIFNNIHVHELYSTKAINLLNVRGPNPTHEYVKLFQKFNHFLETAHFLTECMIISKKITQI